MSVHWIRSETLRKPKEAGGLGFVNFKCLNLAFLAKQGWRIAQNPHLLVSRLFKAKYFPNAGILDASLHHRPSHVWRSIFSSLPVIAYGCSRVHNSSVLHWEHNSSGCLDIKSAYKVAEMLHSNSYCNEGEQSNDSHLRKFWKQLWKLPIPRKIKIFAWRGYLEGLPTGAQLKRRHLQGNLHCHICHFHIEDDLHSFLRCWWSKAVWGYLEIDLPCKCQDFAGLADVLYHCYTASSPDTLCKILIAMWFCWYNRNLVVHGNHIISPSVASRIIIMLHKEYCRNNKSILQCINSSNLQWKKPQGSYVKINCDGSWNDTSKTGRVGVLARDNTGTVLDVRSSFLQQCNSILDCEDKALMEGMKLARLLQLQNVIFEVDNKEIALNITYGMKKGIWQYPWFHYICKLLEIKMNWQILYARREANVAADTIARKANMERWCWSKLDAIPLLHNLVQLF